MLHGLGGVTPRTWRKAIGYTLLLGWFSFLAFGGLRHAEAVEVGRGLEIGGVHRASDVLPWIRGYASNDWDVRRAWSYGRAALGLSYLRHYVRTTEEWTQAFATGVGTDGAEAPVTPARPLRPWRDFLVEYPPGYFLAVLPLAALASTPDVYRVLFVLEMAAFALAALYLAERLRRRRAPDSPSITGWGALCLVLVGVVLTHRMDALVSLELVLLLWAVVESRGGMAGVMTALLFWTKGVPAVAALFLALPLARQRRWALLGRWALVASLATVVLWVPAVWIAGGSLLEAARYHAQRPLQVESTAAAISGLVEAVVHGSAWPVESHGASGVRGPVAWGLGTLGQLLLLVGWGWLAVRARGSNLGAQAATATAALVLWMVLGPVFSPQFLVWVLPVAALAGSLAGGKALPLFAGLCALNQVVYPLAYMAVKTLQPWACGLVLVRNGLLGAWAVWVFSRLQPTELAESATPLSAVARPEQSGS